MSTEARWRRVYSRDWLQSAFRGLDDGARVVWAYCSTGPQSTSVGIYRLSTAVAVEELGNVTAEEFERRLDAVCRAFDWKFDAAVRVLWIPEWLEQNPPQSPNVVVNWAKLLKNVPDCDIKFDAARAISQYLKDKPEAFRKAFESLWKDFANSKSKPKSNQRSEIREQESREQVEGSYEGVNSAIPQRIRDVAASAIGFCGVDESIEEKSKVFYRNWNLKHPNEIPSSAYVLSAIEIETLKKRAMRRSA